MVDRARETNLINNERGRERGCDAGSNPAGAMFIITFINGRDSCVSMVKSLDLDRSVFDGVLFNSSREFVTIADGKIAEDFFYYDFGYFDCSEKILLDDGKIRQGLYDLVNRVSKEHEIPFGLLKGNTVLARGYSGIDEPDEFEEDEEVSNQKVYLIPNMVGVYLRRKVFLGEKALKTLIPLEDLNYAYRIIELVSD